MAGAAVPVDLGARLAARAQLELAPGTLVSAEEARWVLDEPTLPDGPRRPWSAWLAVLGAEHAGPITTWTRAAEVLGVSADTLARRRKDRSDRTEPWWATVDDVRAWWSRLIAPVERTARTRAVRSSAAPSGRAVDLTELARDLTGRNGR